MIQALVTLSALPSRATSSATIDKVAFLTALDGVTRYGLGEAVKAILKGALAHAFLPSPPELRMQCDKAMEHHVRMRERIALRERAERERPPAKAPLSVEEKRRQQERMRAFHASLEGGKEHESAAAIEAERASVRARYGMTDETLAGLKDRPLDGNWKRTA